MSLFLSSSEGKLYPHTQEMVQVKRGIQKKEKNRNEKERQKKKTNKEKTRKAKDTKHLTFSSPVKKNFIPIHKKWFKL